MPRAWSAGDSPGCSAMACMACSSIRRRSSPDMGCGSPFSSGRRPAGARPASPNGNLAPGRRLCPSTNPSPDMNLPPFPPARRPWRGRPGRPWVAGGSLSHLHLPDQFRLDLQVLFQTRGQRAVAADPAQYCEETIIMRIRNVASLLAETLEEYAQGQGSVAPVPLGWALACFWGGGNFIMWRREAAYGFAVGAAVGGGLLSLGWLVGAATHWDVERWLPVAYVGLLAAAGAYGGSRWAALQQLA